MRNIFKPSTSSMYLEGNHPFFAALVGAWLGLALLKFGNPIIFDQQIRPPANILEFIYQPWPVLWGYGLLVLVAVLGVRAWRWTTNAPLKVILLPAVWLLWQCVAATQTVDGRLTRATLWHYTSCVLSFYIGLFALSRVQTLTGLWAIWTGAFLLVLASGFHQHFGGLEETRRWFFEVYLPTLSHPPPAEFMQKVQSQRIYATLFYPNTLAGVILLLLPMALAWLWRLPNSTRSAKAVLVIVVTLASLACMFWSGSKAGWLILVVIGGVAFLRWPIERRIKATVMAILLAAGLAGFLVKYRNYFTSGATSVVARFDYWKAAGQIMKDKPRFGSGPGTFGVVYKRLKNPESEMSKLAHNDYLQQGSDAGLVALLTYAALIAGSLGALYRKCRDDSLEFGAWLGLLGIAVQGLVEFGLFIPALAWPQFLLMGWLWGRGE